MTEDKRLFAPSAARNRDPIFDVLRHELPEQGLVLEIASGSGEHIVHFASRSPHLTFRPSDPRQEARESTTAWIACSGVANVLPPLALDVTQTNWPVTDANAIICINMIHISPWSATEGLFAGAASILSRGAPLYLYGPFQRKGVLTAPSNAEFDAKLRAENPSWGVRDLEAVTACALKNGFAPPAIIDMPANNLSLVFRFA